MKILIVSDAWYPQVNGVVRTLDMTRNELERLGHQVPMVTPDQFRSVPCPTYPEIRLALAGRRSVGQRILASSPDCIHIATEGPLGLAARSFCVREGLAFTTAYHTKFPEYIKARTGLPLRCSYAWLRWFHRPSQGVMVASESVRHELSQWRIANLKTWTRGVDTSLFHPQGKGFPDTPRPVLLYVGRVSIEKNIEEFLRLNCRGTKVVVGDGPQLESLRRRYPAVRFVGVKRGAELAAFYAAADVMVFPSRTDTFGLVMLEALASGVPVAAHPVPGPLDVIGCAPVGCLAQDLAWAVKYALECSPESCRRHAEGFSWQRCAEMFLANLHPANLAHQPARGAFRPCDSQI